MGGGGGSAALNSKWYVIRKNGVVRIVGQVTRNVLYALNKLEFWGCIRENLAPQAILCVFHARVLFQAVNVFTSRRFEDQDCSSGKLPAPQAFVICLIYFNCLFIIVNCWVLWKGIHIHTKFSMYLTSELY